MCVLVPDLKLLAWVLDLMGGFLYGLLVAAQAARGDALGYECRMQAT
jgi:hypothetical protein